MEKTNAMRLLDAADIPYQAHTYDPELTDGVSVAAAVGIDADRVFKTLVTVGATGEHFVFVIPVGLTLDLKKAAKAAGVKNIAMIRQKELLPLTGYVHGGCSPLGQKKLFRTFFDETAILFDQIVFSAGKRGLQIETAPDPLVAYLKASYADLT